MRADHPSLVHALPLLVLALHPFIRAPRSERGADTSAACLTAQGSPLPLIERPAADGPGPLVLLLTGDGGWVNADQRVAEGLVARGSPVVGVNVRSYLGRQRAPDEVARDFACVARAYLRRWHRDRLLLLGYSRGADLAPFAAARWEGDLRGRLVMVALVSMSGSVNFRFHLTDLVRDVARPDDVPVAPEVSRLRGLTVLCIYGADDRTSGCPATDPAIVTRAVRPGGHRITGGIGAIVDLLGPALAPSSPAARQAPQVTGPPGGAPLRR